MERGLNYRITTAANLQGLQKMAQGLQQTQRALVQVAQAMNQMSVAQSRTARNIDMLNNRMAVMRQRLAAMRTQTRAVTKGVGDMATSMGFLLKTLRRFLTYMVLFIAMGGIKRGFDQLIRAAIGFNKAMEEGTIAMAGIILATGKFADASGNLLSIAQALPLAMQAGGRQMKLLQQEALATTGNFEAMAEAMQVAIAPGLAAGMSLDQIRLLSRRISQAATALSMPGQQLPEEIRSLLSGTIRPQTTRIATALGIRSEDVRKWKEMGTFTEEVLKRFEAFEKIEKPLSNTFSMLVNKVKDAFLALSGEAGAGFFGELKGLLADTFGVLTEGGAGGLKVAPAAVAGLTSMFESLADIIKRVRERLNELSFDDIRKFGESFGAIISGIGQTLFTILEAGIFWVSAISTGLKNIVDLLGGPFIGFLAKAVIHLTVFAKLFGGIRSLLPFLVSSFDKMIAKQAILSASTKAWASNLAGGLARIGTSIISVAAVLPLLDTIKDFIVPGGAASGVPSVMQAMRAGFMTILSSAKSTGEYVAKVEAEMAAAEDAADGVVRKGMDPWLDRVRQLQPILISTGEALTRQEEALRKMDENTKSLIQRFDLMRNTPILSGRAGEIQTRMLDAQVDAQNKIKEMLTEQQSRVARISAIEREQQEVRQRMQALGGEHLKDFNMLVDAELKRTRFQERLRVLDEREAEIGDKRAEHADELKLIYEDRYYLMQKMAKIEKDTAGFGGRSETARQAALQLLDLTRQRTKANTELGILREQALGVEQKVLEAMSLQLAVENELAAKKIESDLSRGGADNLAAEQEIFQLQSQRANLASVEAARAKANAIQAQAALVYAAQENQQNIKSLQAQLAGAQTEQERLSLRRLITAESVQNAIEEGDLLLKLQQATEELRRQKQISEGTFGEGMLDGMRQFAEEAPTAFQGGLDVMKQALDAFADLVANTIVDAFDPTADVNLQERIGRFIQDIGRQLLQLAVRMAMAQAFGAIVPGGGLLGPALPSSAAPFGLAAGGPVPPAGLPASDTVPIWATPGEFMMKAAAVQKYGADMMAAINQGLVDPTALRGLQAVRRARRGFPGRMGYADGGEITPGNMVPVTQPAGVTEAVIVANDEALDRILSGGKGAMLKFFRDNKSTLKGLLS